MIAPGTPETRAVIGLEIHIQLDTRTKMFCGDAVRHDAAPNTDVCPVCLGLPGALPSPNMRAVELAARAAFVLSAQVHRHSRFVRKSYFYPDLPKGYQITQLDQPIATGGTLAITPDRSIRIRRIHIEEDAGKLLHDRVAGRTAIDLNRCGIPLLEIVTEPDLFSGRDAADAARALRRVMRYAGISECDMELGSLRIDANVSLGAGAAFTEIKNVNSFAHVERAIDAEVDRQRRMAENGTRVRHETLSWDADHASLHVMRVKEERAEYRYMEEPDLPHLHLDDALIARARAALPELPLDRSARYREKMSLPAPMADAMVASRALADYFDSVVTAGVAPMTAASWIQTVTLAWCNANACDVTGYPVDAATLASALRHMESGRITREAARRLVAALETGDRDEEAVIRRLFLDDRASGASIASWIDAILREEHILVERYRAGEKNLFGFLMGKLMMQAGTTADPRELANRLRQAIGDA